MRERWWPRHESGRRTLPRTVPHGWANQPASAAAAAGRSLTKILLLQYGTARSSRLVSPPDRWTTARCREPAGIPSAKRGPPLRSGLMRRATKMYGGGPIWCRNMSFQRRCPAPTPTAPALFRSFWRNCAVKKKISPERTATDRELATLSSSSSPRSGLGIFMKHPGSGSRIRLCGFENCLLLVSG